jgi:hypothetical protein
VKLEQGDELAGKRVNVGFRETIEDGVELLREGLEVLKGLRVGGRYR